MSERTVRLPDVGEGIAEAELVEWHVALGDLVREDDVLAEVMTDKATVEIPSPFEGEITWLGADAGVVMAIGSDLVRIRVGATAGEASADAKEPAAEELAPAPDGGFTEEARQREPAEPPTKPVASPTARKSPPAAAPRTGDVVPPARRRPGERPLASPAVRLRAREAGVDLRRVAGTGPAGRIGHGDLDAFLEAPESVGAGARPQRRTDVTEVKVTGLRRRIAERMSLAKQRIPHFTIVEEVDVTALEELRATLNRDLAPGRTKLTLLPFVLRALVRALGEQPQLNARFDDEAGIVHRHGAVHVGIATQTPGGLLVPVVRNTEARDIWDCAAEIVRLAGEARAGTAGREDLSGSTITVTSLGTLGGIATTPVINHPEVAIVGINKIAVRPSWNGSTFVPRKMMNLSSSFDHRVVDGYDAAVFVQRLKSLIETPATIFMDA